MWKVKTHDPNYKCWPEKKDTSLYRKRHVIFLVEDDLVSGHLQFMTQM